MRFRRAASDTIVNEPVMRACEAMIAAMVERITAKGRRPSGSISKKGLRSEILWSSILLELARSQAPWPR